MRQSVINYVKENGIKLAANSKALKLINNGASEAEVAVALQTTKAYKEDSTLRQMCQEVVAEAGKEQADSAKKPENHSNSARRGENERYQFHSIFLFCEKPKKSKSYWINSNTFNSLVLPKEAFPSVKWEDNEPTKVIIRLAQYDYKKKHFRKYTCYYQ